jgi:hypothetical protein
MDAVPVETAWRFEEVAFCPPMADLRLFFGETGHG